MTEAIEKTPAAATSTAVAVQMNDGRTVNFTEKQKLKKDYNLNADTGLVDVLIDFANGQTVAISIDPSSDVGKRLAGHGAIQKLGDSAAGAETVEDAFESVLEVATRLANGEFNKEREGGGGGAKGSSELVRALVVVMGQPIEAVRAMMASLSAADKMALRRVDEVAAEIEKIRASKPASKTEAEKAKKGADLLAGLKRGELPAKTEEPTGTGDGEQAPQE